MLASAMASESWVDDRRSRSALMRSSNSSRRLLAPMISVSCWTYPVDDVGMV